MPSEILSAAYEIRRPAAHIIENDGEAIAVAH